MAIKQLKFVKSNGKSASGIYEYICRLDNHQSNSDKCLLTGHANLPSFAEDKPQYFWKVADKNERANAKCSTHIVVTLPRELDLDQQAALMADFVERNFKGCPLSWAIHEGYDQHNPHAHLQICERRITSEKEKAFSQTRFFKRNGVKKDRTLNHKSFCSHLNRQYAGSINHHLELAGSEERLDTEPQNKEFLEMSFSEKVQQHMDRQMAELEEKHKKELAEKLKNLKQEKEEEYVWQREDFGRDESTIDNTRESNAVDERERGKAGEESRSIFGNAQRNPEREFNTATTKSEDNQPAPGITSFLINLFTKRSQSRDSENSQSDRRIKTRIKERTQPGRLREFTQRIFKFLKDSWLSVFKTKALKKIKETEIIIKVEPEHIPDFKEVEITKTQKLRGKSVSISDNLTKEENRQNLSIRIKF